MLHLLSFLTILVVALAGPPVSQKAETIDGILAAALKDKSPATHFSDGSVLVEMDMRLNKDQYEALHGNKKESTYAGLRDERYRWTDNIVPIEIHPVFNEAEVAVIQGAMDEWSRYTCLRMVPYTNQDNYIRVINAAGCWSMVGMIGGRQDLSLQLGSCVYHHTTVHELGHAVGFHHEQTRPDRDDYVTVLEENIFPGLAYNFDKYDWDMINDQGVTYDYWSIMHYSQYAFSGNGLPTIEPHDPEYKTVIGSVPGLSFKDIKQANLMYHCAEHCTNECPEKAIRDEDCACWCNTLNPRDPLILWDGESECKGGDDAEEACIDYYDECEDWEAQGECDNNAYWMSQNCMKSCRVCGPDPACRDFDSLCPYWAMTGECQRNPGWMMINCRFSCKVCGEHPEFGECEDRWDMCAEAASNGVCETNSEAMLTECPVSCKSCGDDVECKNWDSRCFIWKNDNRCVEDEEFMRLHCGQECGFCTGGTLPDCRDYAKSSDCEWWAANGECSYNPGWMNRKCPLSCRICGDNAMCLDHDVFCHEWAYEGACQEDLEYMYFACPAECGFCEGEPDDRPGCKNYDQNCEGWIAAGECDINPDGMLYYCPRGCQACGPGTLCKDWHSECSQWKDEGECRSNPTYMNRHCPVSCDTCCEDPDGCDVIGGPGPGLCSDYETCYDYLEDCAEKAAAGECFSNPGDMLRECPISCKLCGDEVDCQDYNTGCERWAFIGDCTNNPSYMDMYCRKSCRCCEDPEDPPEIPDPDPICRERDPCEDYYVDECRTWAQEGQCDTNTDEMLRLCPLSCKICGSDAECHDYKADCELWASPGWDECEDNPSFMHDYCRKSCNCCGGSSVRKAVPHRECIAHDPCIDYEDDCATKAAAGECETNPDDMLRLCRLSCKVCGEGQECHDFDEDCASFASYGECDNNPTYMQLYCRESCECCSE